MNNADPAQLDTLDPKQCSSPMKHGEHLLVVHTEDGDENYRCDGREEDE